MIRPWYRSLVFWLGIPGLGFIVWFWIASMSSQDGYENWVTAKGPFEQTSKDLVVHGGSRIYYSWCAFDKMPGRTVERHYPMVRFRNKTEGTGWFPALGHFAGRPDPGQVRHTISLPHWFFLAIYLGLWLFAYRLRTRWVRHRYESLTMGEWKARDHAARAAGHGDGDTTPPPPPDPRSTRSKIFRRDE